MYNFLFLFYQSLLFSGCAKHKLCFKNGSLRCFLAAYFFDKQSYYLSCHFLNGLLNARYVADAPLLKNTVVGNYLKVVGNFFAKAYCRLVKIL